MFAFRWHIIVRRRRRRRVEHLANDLILFWLVRPTDPDPRTHSGAGARVYPAPSGLSAVDRIRQRRRFGVPSVRRAK